MSVNLNQALVSALVWHFDSLGVKESVTCLVEGLISHMQLSHSESCTMKFSSKATILMSQQLPFAAVVAFKQGTPGVSRGLKQPGRMLSLGIIHISSASSTRQCTACISLITYQHLFYRHWFDHKKIMFFES